MLQAEVIMKKYFYILIFILLIMSFKVTAKEKVLFNKCIDGDTVSLIVNGKTRRVRMLAIDTPESVTPERPIGEYGVDASKYTCELITNAKNIYLEFDDNSDKEDKYERLLAYIYADDVMIQKELLKMGYAKVAYLYGDYKYTDEFKELERIAKENKIGIWQDYKEEEKQKEIEEEKSFFEELIDIIMKIIKAIINFFKFML